MSDDEDAYHRIRQIPEVKRLIGARLVDVSETDADERAERDEVTLLFDNGGTLTFPMSGKGFDLHVMEETPVPTDELDPTLFPVHTQLPAEPAAQSETPILDAARAGVKAQLAEGTGVSLGAVVSDGSAGVQVSAGKSWASGWSVAATAQWVRDKGASAMAFVGWRPKG
jgi:hypothetical protein